MPGLGGFATYALERLSEILSDWKLQFPDPKPSEGIVIENQVLVLRAIAHQPGSIIKDEEPYRAGKPLRYRTVRRLLDLGLLTSGRDDRGIDYITVTPKGWDRITDVDKA
jgi:hypothetical protein